MLHFLRNGVSRACRCALGKTVALVVMTTLYIVLYVTIFIGIICILYFTIHEFFCLICYIKCKSCMHIAVGRCVGVLGTWGNFSHSGRPARS